MNKTGLWGFSFIKVGLFLVCLVCLLFPPWSGYEKKRLILNEIKFWEQMNATYPDILLYGKAHVNYPVGSIEMLCQVLLKNKDSCPPAEYEAIDGGKNFIFGRYLGSLGTQDVNVIGWCTNDSKFYYKTANVCLPDDYLKSFNGK